MSRITYWSEAESYKIRRCCLAFEADDEDDGVAVETEGNEGVAEGLLARVMRISESLLLACAIADRSFNSWASVLSSRLANAPNLNDFTLCVHGIQEVK